MTEAPFSKEDLAKRWGCSTQPIDDLIRNGKLKAFKVGRRVLVSADEVCRFENTSYKEDNT